MELHLLHFLIICPLVFLGGFVDAAAGGGGLIALPAYLLAGLPAHMAIGTNKLSSAMGTSVALWRYARSGFVDWRLAPPCVLCAFGGSACGARLALLLDEGVFRLLMLAILPLTALYVLRSQSLAPEGAAGGAPYLPMRAGAMAASLLVGAYDGFYGPGTGTFLLLLLTGLCRMPLVAANGLTKAINLATNLAALLVFLGNGQVLLPLGLAAGCFGIAGNLLGARCFMRQGTRIARPLILLVLAVFFARTLWELLGGGL